MTKKELLLYIGNKIKEIREMNGFSQTELGDKIGVSKQSICNYEKGERDAGQDNIFNIAEIFDVSIDYFFPPLDGNNANEPEPYDPDVQEILNLLNRDEELKILFMKTGHLENGDRKQLVKVLKALLPNGDDK